MGNIISAVVEATLFWPNLSTKNDMSGKYQVDLGLLDKQAIKTLESMGVSVKKDPHKNEEYPDRKAFVTGKSNYPIKVVFKSGVEAVDSSEIGNGTKAKIKVVAYEWTFKNNTGIGLGVNKLQVTDLNRYVIEDDEDWDDDDDEVSELDEVLDEDFDDE